MKKLVIALFCLLLVGCQKQEIFLNEEDALEIALDNEALTEEQITDTEIKKKDESYIITFNTKEGTYIFKVSTSGTLLGRKFEPVEVEQTEEKKEDKNKTNLATKPQIDNKKVDVPEEITNSDANKSYSAALNIFGLSDSYIQSVTIREDENSFIVKLKLTNGDGITYTAKIQKETFTVLEYYQE